jgi:glycosyltransferase involved in cell wall biosynthesis
MSNACASSAVSDKFTDPGEAPRISVIIPAYNAEKYIVQSIRSVLAQNYSPIEILVVDDGGTDRTIEIIRHEAPQARIISQANGGAAAARNTGLRNATGELICFLDADDGWFPGKLEAMVAYLRRHPEAGLVSHELLHWKPDRSGDYPELVRPDRRGLPETEAGRTGWIYPVLLLEGCMVHTSSIMLRREVFEHVGFFNTDLKVGEDYDYWLRASQKYQIHTLNEIYSFYRNSVPGSLTNKTHPENYEYKVLLAAVERYGLSSPGGEYVSEKKVSSRLAKLAFDFGYVHYHHGSPVHARAAFIQALRHDPRLWRALAYLFAATFKSTPNLMSR